MFLDGQGKSARERFFVRKVKRKEGFVLHHNVLNAFSRFGGGNLPLLRLDQVAGLVSVPRAGAGSKAWLPGGDGKSDHANQQEQDAGGKNAPLECDDSLHVFFEEILQCPISYIAIRVAARQPASVRNPGDYHLEGRLCSSGRFSRACIYFGGRASQSGCPCWLTFEETSS